MAYDFHELSPYVLIGNPLTLAMIELFAVPAALVGSLLYPFGLDGWVWSYLGAGIAIDHEGRRLDRLGARRQHRPAGLCALVHRLPDARRALRRAVADVGPCD